jgi:hypothetical protein
MVGLGDAFGPDPRQLIMAMTLGGGAPFGIPAPPRAYGKGSVQSIASPSRQPLQALDALARLPGQRLFDISMGRAPMPPSPFEDPAGAFNAFFGMMPMGPFGSVRGPVRVPNPTFTLSRNLAPPQREGYPEFRYNILRDGAPIGQTVEGHVIGDTANIEWWGQTGRFGDVGNPADIGIAGLRQLREAMRSDFPDVNTFAGRRISGARGNYNNPPWQQVTIPGIAAPVAGGAAAASTLTGASDNRY